jgi:hypothetical protein
VGNPLMQPIARAAPRALGVRSIECVLHACRRARIARRSRGRLCEPRAAPLQYAGAGGGWVRSCVRWCRPRLAGTSAGRGPLWPAARQWRCPPEARRRGRAQHGRGTPPASGRWNAAPGAAAADGLRRPSRRTSPARKGPSSTRALHTPHRTFGVSAAEHRKRQRECCCAPAADHLVVRRALRFAPAAPSDDRAGAGGRWVPPRHGTRVMAALPACALLCNARVCMVGVSQ